LKYGLVEIDRIHIVAMKLKPIENKNNFTRGNTNEKNTDLAFRTWVLSNSKTH
jgi:hypothetical protein